VKVMHIIGNDRLMVEIGARLGPGPIGKVW